MWRHEVGAAHKSETKQDIVDHVKFFLLFYPEDYNKLYLNNNNKKNLFVVLALML